MLHTTPPAGRYPRGRVRLRPIAMLACAALLTLGSLRVATARPRPELAIGPEPQISAELRAELAAAPRSMAVLALAAAADDDAAIATAQARALAALGPDFEPTHRYRHVPALAGWLSRQGLERLSEVPGLVAASEDPEMRALLEDSVPFIGADRLHRRRITGEGINVAVIDTGVDAGNLDLREAVVDQLCTLSPRDRCGPADNLADDVDGHGTHVAGIVASRGRRAGDGVAPGAGIIAVKYLEERATGAGSNMIEALDLLLERDDLHVINMSLGTTVRYPGDCDDASAYNRGLAAAFGRLRRAGVISVAASGNDSALNEMSSPACIASVVSVGAVDHTQPRAEVASFTNRSASLDLLAPGVSIESSDVRGGVGVKSGTSMAAPHVAGAFALLMGEVPWAGPDLLEQVLKENGQRPTIRLGGNEAVTIKVDAALSALERIEPTATTEAPTATPVTPTVTPEPATATPTEPVVTATPTTRPVTQTPTASPTATLEPLPDTPEPPELAPLYLPRLLRP